MATAKAKETTQGVVKEAAAPKFKVKRNITLPLIKPQIDVPVYIQITGPMFTGKKIDSGKTKDMEPAEMVNCLNLETGEEAQMIVPSVLKGIFEDEYDSDAYVGLGFSVTKHAKASGKRYHPFSVAELEL